MTAANQRYIHANNAAYDNLDPHAVFDVGRAASRINLYDGLYRWVDDPPTLIPWLAESHTVSADELTYTFHLRQGVKFHNDTELTAVDVVYSIERMLALKRGAAELFIEFISPGSTQAADAYTVVFNLTSPSAIFLALVPEILVVNSQLVQQNTINLDWGKTWLKSNCAGSGSFMLQSSDPTMGFTATRFANHFYPWPQDKKLFDQIEFRTVLDVDTRVQGLIDGSYHGTDGFLPYNQITRLQEYSNIQILQKESMRVFYFAFNMSKQPFDNLHFRRALNYAFDYDTFINQNLAGSVVRNPTPNPNTLWGTPSDVSGYTYDLDKAREELALANIQSRTISINSLAGFPETKQASELLATGLQAIGLNTVIEDSPWNTVSSRFCNSETMYDIVPLWKSTYYADPHNWVGELFATRYHGGRNTTWYSNAEFDRMINDAVLVSNQAARSTLYNTAIRHIVDQAVGIFVYNTKWFGPYSNQIDGIRFSPISNGQDMRWAYFK